MATEEGMALEFKDGRVLLGPGGASDDSKVLLEYTTKTAADGTLLFDFHHTFTPEALRGKGLAGQVVKAGFEEAARKSAKVIPTCSYVAGYVERHPEFKDQIAPSSL